MFTSQQSHPEDGGDLPELVRLAKRGDLQAFNRLVLDHQDLAYTLACCLLGDESSSATAVQSGFLRAYRQVRSYHRGSFRAWLLKQVLSACRSPELHPAPKVYPNGNPVIASLRSLPFDGRLAVVLVDLLGIDYSEAAYICGCSTGLFARNLAQARLNLNTI